MEIYAEKTFSPIFIKLETLEEVKQVIEFLDLEDMSESDPEIIYEIINDLKKFIKPYTEYPNKIKNNKK